MMNSLNKESASRAAFRIPTDETIKRYLTTVSQITYYMIRSRVFCFSKECKQHRTGNTFVPPIGGIREWVWNNDFHHHPHYYHNHAFRNKVQLCIWVSSVKKIAQQKCILLPSSKLLPVV